MNYEMIRHEEGQIIEIKILSLDSLLGDGKDMRFLLSGLLDKNIIFNIASLKQIDDNICLKVTEALLSIIIYFRLYSLKKIVLHLQAYSDNSRLEQLIMKTKMDVTKFFAYTLAEAISFIV